MPIKPNGFLTFAKKRQVELEGEGQNFPGGLKEVIGHVGDEWKNMTKEERKPFTDEAQERKKKAKQSTEDASISRGESMRGPIEYSASVAMTPKTKTLGTKDTLKEMLDFTDPLKCYYIIISCTCYCTTEDKLYIPSEIGLNAFSIERGITDMYWTLVDPVNLPAERRMEGKSNAEITGLRLPPFDTRFQDLEKITRNVNQFIRRYSWNEEEGSSIFCLPGQMCEIRGVLDWLKQNTKVPEVDARVRLLPLDLLGYELFGMPKRNLSYQNSKPSGVRLVRPKPPVTPQDSITNPAQCAQVLDSWRVFSFEIVCPHHQVVPALHVKKCALGTVNRYAMTLMELLAPKFILNLKHGIHLPSMNSSQDIDRRNNYLINWGYRADFLDSFDTATSDVVKENKTKKEKIPDKIKVFFQQNNSDGGGRRRVYCSNGNKPKNSVGLSNITC